MLDDNENIRMHELIEFVMSNALTYQTFTGAFVIKNNEIVCKEMTSVVKENDPIAHAELKVIQTAIKKYGMNLEAFQLYTTQKPCVMCASAIVWAGIKEVYFGMNTNHHWQYDKEIHDFFNRNGVKCVGPILEEECKKIDQLLIDHGM